MNLLLPLCAGVAPDSTLAALEELANLGVVVVLEKVTNSLKESAEQIESSSEFDTGRRMAYYEAIWILLSQYVVADISPSDIGLDGFVPERILSDKKQAI